MVNEDQDELVLEMGYSRHEFIHNFPAVAGDSPFQIKQNRIRLFEPGRQLLITLGEDQPREIASLIIPRVHVTFEFTGYSRKELQLFMKRFRSHYHKGGG